MYEFEQQVPKETRRNNNRKKIQYLTCITKLYLRITLKATSVFTNHTLELNLFLLSFKLLLNRIRNEIVEYNSIIYLMDVTSKNVGCNEKDRILNSKKHTCDHLTFCLKKR